MSIKINVECKTHEGRVDCIFDAPFRRFILLCARPLLLMVRGADENKRCTNQGHAAMLINANLHAWHSIASTSPCRFLSFLVLHTQLHNDGCRRIYN